MADFEFHAEHDGTVSVRSAVFQALGAASVCWTPEGIFDDALACQVGERLLVFIRELSGLAGHEQQAWPPKP